MCLASRRENKNGLYVTHTTARAILQAEERLAACNDCCAKTVCVYTSRHLTTVSSPMPMLRVSVHSRQRERHNYTLRLAGDKGAA